MSMSQVAPLPMPPRQRSRARAAVIACGIVLLVIGSPVFLWYHFDIKWGRELERGLAALRAQGMPVTIMDVVPGPVPDDENAATLQELQESVSYHLPKDPFSGEDFVYQVQGEGFTLYSLGSDLDDDGGAGPTDEGHSYDDCDIVWECVR